jgi:hypothetical protein
MRVNESEDWKGELCKDLYSDLGQLKWGTALPLHDLGRSYLNVSPNLAEFITPKMCIFSGAKLVNTTIISVRVVWWLVGRSDNRHFKWSSNVDVSEVGCTRKALRNWRRDSMTEMGCASVGIPVVIYLFERRKES